MLGVLCAAQQQSGWQGVRYSAQALPSGQAGVHPFALQHRASVAADGSDAVLKALNAKGAFGISEAGGTTGVSRVLLV